MVELVCWGCDNIHTCCGRAYYSMVLMVEIGTKYQTSLYFKLSSVIISSGIYIIIERRVQKSVFSFVGLHCTSPLFVFIRLVTLCLPTLCFCSLGYIVRPHSVFSFVGLHCTSPLFAPWVHSGVGKQLLMEDNL